MAVAGSTSPDDAAVVHDQDSIRQREDPVQLDRHEQERLAAVPQRGQAAVDELDGADVDAPRGLSDQQELGIPVQLASQHDLLLVAAGERRRAPGSVGGADVVLRGLLLEAGRDGGAAKPERAVVRRLVVVPEDRALPRRRSAMTSPMRWRSSGHVGDAHPPHVPRRSFPRAAQLAALPLDPAGLDGSNPGERVEQLGLAIPGDACDAHDLAALAR